MYPDQGLRLRCAPQTHSRPKIGKSNPATEWSLLPGCGDDALKDDRVFGPRHHSRARLAERRVNCARAADNGGKPLRLPFGGLVDELDRDRLGPRSLSRFAALDDRDLLVQMLVHIGPNVLGALRAAAQIAGLSRFELALARRPPIARDMILIGHGAPPFPQARAQQSRRRFRHGSRPSPVMRCQRRMAMST